MTWWNQYVGIRYADKGRTRAEGVDCWGLVRLVYAEQFGIELPSYAEEYERTDDPERNAEIIARHREGWIEVDRPQAGDLVLLRVLGEESHVGLVTEPGRMLHADTKAGVVDVHYNSLLWRHRIAGFYRYAAQPVVLPATLAACPHPLRTARLDATVPAGITLAEIPRFLRETGQAEVRIPHTAVMLVDGRVVPAEEWHRVAVQPGQRVEYRALPRGGVARTIASIAIMVAAWYVAPGILGYGFGQAGWAAASAAGATLGVSLTAAGINIAGALLVNAIFPVRLPKQRDPGTPEPQLLLQRANNRHSPYGAIPVVLGRYRYAPPLAAQTYVESNATTSYLRMLLLWGYGPMQISDVRIGDTPIDTFEEVEYETVSGFGDEDLERLERLYGHDVAQLEVNVKLESDGTPEGSVWVERVLSSEVDRITVTLHFPEGLRTIPIEGGAAGKPYPAPFAGNVQVRQLDPDTLEPITNWGEINAVFRGATVNLQPAWFNVDDDAELEPVYRWTRISLDPRNNVIVRTGAFTDDPDEEPSADLLRRQQQAAWGLSQSYARLPELGPSEEPLYDICVYGDTVYDTVDRRDESVSGCDLTLSGFKATIASGTLTRAQSETLRWGREGEKWFKQKDAFTENISFSVPRGVYEVRVRRTTSSDKDYTFTSGNKGIRYHDCYVTHITGYRNERPFRPPVPMCMTAVRIKATNQINGSVEAITGTAQVICLDWDHTTEQWVMRPTRNPASLLRWLWQHPGNAKRVPDERINLDDLADWHNFCREHGFMCDMLVLNQQSVDDTARDIAACGRASPAMRDGKLTVIIDRPRTHIAQHFTPHNSWGFEAVRRLPVLPHAWRVQFDNSERGYQPDERIVPFDGYSVETAELIEGLQLLGVTTPATVYKHAKFHEAQLKLRPEEYSLYADIEHIVCTRGDLVRVTHHVPMWGLGSGRIKARKSDGAVIVLDESMPMQAETQYTVRIRLADGSSVTRTVAAVEEDGYYDELTLTEPVDEDEGEPGNLVMFGALNEESVELVVQSIEPAENLTARITLVDYAPAVYQADQGPIPPFESHITLPPAIVQRTIQERPVIGAILSDETVLERIAPGQYIYCIVAAISNPDTLPDTVTHIEGQIAYVDSGDWPVAGELFPISGGQVRFVGVEEGEQYRVRVRYVDQQGRTGPWSDVATHTVVGKTSRPAKAGAITLEIDGAALRMSWPENQEPDLAGYEVRTTDSGWGDGNHVFRGAATSCYVIPGPVGVETTWYLRPFDDAGLYAEESASVSYTTAAPPNPSTITKTFADTSLTNATITLDWDDVDPPFGLDAYVVSYGDVVKIVKASTITLPADWIGNRTFTVRTRDMLGNLSSGASKVVQKLRPDKPRNVHAQVIDNNVLLSWTLPERTTLPISHTLIKRGETWEGAEDVGEKAGTFTVVQETSGGIYRYWLATVDTDGYESDPVSITVNVMEPPDFVFHGRIDSTLDGTLTQATLSAGAVLMPVDTEETWEEHFTDRNWSSPKAQIDAGYPRYIQPTPASGSYSEVFDFGTVVASSKVSVTYDGEAVAGDPQLWPKIDISADGVTWTEYDGFAEVYATQFRYVRFTLAVDNDGDTALYRLKGVTCLLSTKLKTDAGRTICSASDPAGTVANFGVMLYDVRGITVTPKGSAPVTVVYDFNDVVLSGTYTVSSGVLTANVANHELVAGQNVRLIIVSGDAEPRVATVASIIDANTFTVAVDDPDTSGDLSIYPQGFRIYLYDSSGNRASGEVSWNVRGAG